MSVTLLLIAGSTAPFLDNSDNGLTLIISLIP